ncbi:MAG: hypothetical protein ACKO1J_00465 [Tagaea sp.]
MRLRYLTYVFLALLAFAPAAFAQSIHLQPVGTEVSGTVRFARADVPLPPGTWVLVSAGEERSGGINGNSPSRLPFAGLARIDNNSLAGLVTLSGTLQHENVTWVRERQCDRTDWYFADADRNFNTADQHCQYVTHYVRAWTASDNQSEQTRALIAGLRAKSIALPPTTVVSFVRRAQRGEYLNVTYEISPASAGGPVARSNTWSSSEWHKDKIAENPEFKRFMDAWVEWSKQMAPKVRDGFGRSLGGYAPIALNFAPPAGATTLASPAATPASAQPARPLPPGHMVPKVGTRFVTNTGYVDIVRVDGISIVTVNPSNAGGTWYASGLLPLSTSTRFDRALAESIFPLAIGKKVDFVQQAATGTDSWKNSLEVVRQETLTVDGRAYPTFVVDARTEAVGPGMAEFVRKRTLWYSPEAGWLLRLREEQLAGPPQRMNNWDVVRIVPPS